MIFMKMKNAPWVSPKARLIKLGVWQPQAPKAILCFGGVWPDYIGRERIIPMMS